MADEKKKPDVEETPQDEKKPEASEPKPAEEKKEEPAKDEKSEEKASDDKQADENGSTILKTKQTHTKRKCTSPVKTDNRKNTPFMVE